MDKLRSVLKAGKMTGENQPRLRLIKMGDKTT